MNFSTGFHVAKRNFIHWNGMIEELIRSDFGSENRELSAWIRFGVNTAWYFPFQSGPSQPQLKSTKRIGVFRRHGHWLCDPRGCSGDMHIINTLIEIPMRPDRSVRLLVIP